MPIFGGTSVENYLTERFGPLAFNEHQRHLTPDRFRWSVESANHIPVAQLDRLFPPGWFASSFATVRHPLPRLVSAFFFWRDFMKRIPLSAEFNAWFQKAAAELDTAPYRYGAHLLPQTGLVPEAARVFRLEDGLDSIVPYLDGMAGNRDGSRTIPSRNVGRWRAEESAPQPTQATLDLLARVYAADFERFGYEPKLSVAAAATLPDLSISGAPPSVRRRSFSERLVRNLMKRAGM
ncbi:MAG: hypothetical protein B7Z31_14945 [Rhodobacterales bacterium 12-65-15]|nr:MAG: hypothetical protein B7Z31_14945 [Rhodobacterales bacterium 12-65-15]